MAAVTQYQLHLIPHSKHSSAMTHCVTMRLINFLLLVLLALLVDGLSVQPSTILLLSAAVPPAAEPHVLPVVILEPLILNYTRHLAAHDVDETALFERFTADDTDSTSVPFTLSHSLHLLRPSTGSDTPLLVHNVSFTHSTAAPADSSHSACTSSVLQHGLRLADCHVLPAELQPNERVSVLLSYRPLATSVPSVYYVLIHTTEALYVSQMHLILPSSLAAYQHADFVSPALRSPASSAVGTVRSLLLSLPLLAFLGVSVLLFFAQTGQIHSSSVAALIQPLPILPSLHAALVPFLYSSEAPVKGKSPSVPQLITLTTSAAVMAAPYQPSPLHALLRRKAGSTSSAASQVNSTTPAMSSPKPSAGTASLRAQSTDPVTVDSAPSSPLAAPPMDLPDSALDLTQITFRHFKSLSVGTGEAMMKEAEREVRRKRRTSKQSAKTADGEEHKKVEVNGVVEPDIVSPPQTRRTMSVGSSGPLFFRFDRITKEMDERSSDGSRVGSDSSSGSTNTSNSDSDEERSKDNSRESSPEQQSQRTVAVVKPALTTSKPLDASAQPFTPRSSLATHVESASIQPPTAQPVQSSARLVQPAPTSYTPRASFYSSQRASPSPRSAYSHDAASPCAYQGYEGKERSVSQQLSPAMSFTSAPLNATYPSYISPRHSALPPRNVHPPSVSPRYSTFHYQQQQPLQPRPYNTSFRNTALSASPDYAASGNTNLSVSYSPPRSAASVFPPSQPQQPQQPIIVYDHTDTITYSPTASSPVQRPRLPHLILPKSPDSAPSLAPTSPQALRPAASPSHRFLHVSGAGTMRDSKWTANSEKDSSHWPDTHPPPHRRQPTPFSISMSPSVARSKEESLYEISEEDGEQQQPASIWSTVRSSSMSVINLNSSATVFPYQSYPSRPIAPPSSSWSSPTSPSHSYALPSLSSSAASSPATSPLLTGGDAEADDRDEDLMDLRAMEETSEASVTDDVRDVPDEDDVSGLADALGALGRARALHSIQLSLAQSRNAATHDSEAETDSSGKENVAQRGSNSVVDAPVGAIKAEAFPAPVFG